MLPNSPVQNSTLDLGILKNFDPLDSDRIPGAIQQLIGHPLFNLTPMGESFTLKM